MEKTYRGVVMLNKPPIDKIAAMAVLERAQGSEVEVTALWDENSCPEEQMRKWESEGILPIDLGDDKYHVGINEVGSATEFVLRHIVGCETSAEGVLVEMLDKNNKTGYLKGPFMAIAWILRELYELDECDQREVIKLAAHVVRVFLEAEDGVGIDKNRDDAGLSKFEDLLEKTAKCNFSPLTPASYLKDLWRLGYAEEEIRERVIWWIDGWKKVKAKMAEADEEIEKLDLSKVENIAGMTVFFLETNNKFLSKLVAKKVDVLVVKNPTGHAAILAYRFDQTGLADELLRHEPGRWYYQETTGMLINGGVIYKGVQPTSLGAVDFIALLKKFPPRRCHQGNRGRQIFHGRSR